MSTSIISSRTANYGDFESIALKHLASIGIRHVEISVPPKAKIDATREALAAHGLTAASLQAECDVSRHDIAERIEAQMSAFDALGARFMFVSVKAGSTPLDTVYGRLREAGEVAAAHGVTIVMETHPDLITNADTARRTMESVNHPNVRVNFDTANVYFYNKGVDGVEELRKIVEYVGAMHLKDTDGGYRSWHFPALGRGIVNFRDTFDVLDCAGFDGPCTLEIEGVEGETANERMVCERMAESVAYLRRLGRL
jgi:inosose dehydratase